MEKTTAENIFRLIAKLTDENLITNDKHDTLNLLSALILEDFSELIDRTTYANKYIVFDRIKNLLASIQLYANVPELINKHVIGCPYFRAGAFAWPQVESLKLSDSLSFNGHFLSRSVPTIITFSPVNSIPKVITASHTEVTLNADEYRTFLQCDYGNEKSDQIDLTTVVSLVLLTSSEIQPSQAILFLPNVEKDVTSWYHALLHSVDSLMLPCSQANADSTLELITQGNVKNVLLVDRGKPNTYPSNTHFEIALRSVDSHIIPDLSSQKYHNFCCQYIFYTILSELLWYFGEETLQLKQRLRIYNEDVMYLAQDDESQDVLKKERADTKRELERIENLAKQYLLLGESFGDLFSQLQSQFDILEVPIEYDNHSLSPEDLLSSMYRISVFCREISPEAQVNAKDIFKQFRLLSEKHANPAIANIIYSDFMNRAPSHSDLAIFEKAQLREPFLKNYSFTTQMICPFPNRFVGRSSIPFVI